MSRSAIRKKLEQLDARRQVLVARLAKQERAHDTRRKILLGALVLHSLQRSHDAGYSRHLGDWLREELPGFLTRDGDRALFDDILSPSTTAEEQNDETKG